MYKDRISSLTVHFTDKNGTTTTAKVDHNGHWAHTLTEDRHSSSEYTDFAPEFLAPTLSLLLEIM